MPRNTREYLIRYATQIEDAHNKILAICARMIDTYTDANPEHQEFFKLVGEASIQIRDQVEAFRRDRM